MAQMHQIQYCGKVLLCGFDHFLLRTEHKSDDFLIEIQIKVVPYIILTQSAVTLCFSIKVTIVINSAYFACVSD